MKALQTVVSLVQTIYAVFIAWMPASMQVLFGVVLALSLFIMVVKIIGMVLNAIPFL